MVWWGIFGAIQAINAQTPWWFSVIINQFTQYHTGDYITTGNYGTIQLWSTWLLKLFQRSWNWLTTNFYDDGINTIYFNNFDTPEVLEQNQVPLADSIRDFTGGTNWEGQNGWKYWYKTIISSEEDIVSYPYKRHNFVDCDVSDEFPVPPPATQTGVEVEDNFCSDLWHISRICTTIPWDPCGPDWDMYCTRTCISVEEISGIWSTVTNINLLTYNYGINLRTIWTNPIVTHNFANIGERDAHPWSGTVNSLSELSWSNNIPIIRQRTSNLSGKIKIINNIQDDENNCWNGINYKIYTGIIENWDTLTGVKPIETYYLPNLSATTIERSLNIRTGQNIFFEIDNGWNNECDGTYNHIQIYDITNNSEITGWPSYTTSGIYWWALEFSGNQLFSLGTGINQWSWITISAWINTRDDTRKQGIITKYNSYWVVVKSWTIRVSPSTYWMWQDTGIPVEENTWTHIAWTYNWQTMYTYKNGWSQNSGGRTRSYNINGNLQQNDKLTYIWYDDTNKRWWDWYIDEFRMYNTGFTSWQIQELYESNLKLISSWTENSWEFISNKTGLIDGLKLYTNNIFKFPATIISTGNITNNRQIPICTSCTDIICQIWTITNAGSFLWNDFICRNPDREQNSFNNGISTIKIDQNENIIIGWWFTQYNWTIANRIIRLDSNGNIDNTFYSWSGFNSSVNVIEIDNEWKILVGWRFTDYNWTTANRIIRLNSDWSIDDTFDPWSWFNFSVYAINIDNNWNILVGWSFTEYNWTNADRIIRLTSTWIIDTTFNIWFDDNWVYTIITDNEWKILVGWWFTEYNWWSNAYNIIRLNSDGTVDTTFNLWWWFNSAVYTININNSWNILVGWSFTGYNWVSSDRIIRLTSTWTIETTFDIWFDNLVFDTEIDDNWKILIGWWFTWYNWTTANYIIRLNYDGTIDNTFNSWSGFDYVVQEIETDNNWNFIIWWFFTRFNWDTSQKYITKLNNNWFREYNTYNLSSITTTWSILIDTNWPILTLRTWFVVYESQPIIATWFRYDSGMIWNVTTWFDRWRWRDLDWAWDITTNGENIMDFWIENEPIIKQIKIRVKDFIGNKSYWTGIIQRVNTWPVLTGNKDIYTGLVEDNITFIASGYDIDGEPLTYRWYSWWNCIFSWIIQWETNQTFTTGRETVDEIYLSYKISDKQNIWSCWNITGQRNEPTTSWILLSNNSWSSFWWWSTGQIGITWTIIYSWSLWTCSSDDNYTYYTWYGIGNDYCIIESWTEQIVLWRYGVNRYNTLFSQTGTRINPYLINENIKPFIIEFQNTNLTWFTRSLSWSNTTRKIESQIYNSWLIWLYNFDKILLTDSEKDFSAIQSGKNRSYWRRPKGTWTYQLLQYYAPSQQRIISTPIEDFDGLFIEKNELNPGYNYWDAIVWRTSPINATIEIDYTLTDANTSCGDWIKYKLLKNDSTNILATWAFESKTITTQIFSWEIIYLVVNSLNNNDCDNTNYNIKVYQLPESNLGTKWNYQWTNSWAIYTTWKYNWALSFPENSYITIGTGIQSNKMSISARIYKLSWDHQTIIQKRWSYGMVLFNNTLQVANQNTTRRYDTQISLPDDTRTHIGRSYDGTTMKVYINGKQQRSNTVIWTIPSNNYAINIGYSFSNGPRNGLIDEIYIYNYAVDSGVFASLYNHNLNRISRDKRQRTSNQSWAIYDWRYYFETKVNWIPTNTWEIIRDFSAPLFTGFIGLTGRESNSLTITGFWYDSGYYISGYQFRYNITGERSNRSNISTGNSFVVAKQDEPITWLIEIKITDFFWHETIWTGIMEWVNTWPVIIGNNDFYRKLGQNIALIASWYDTDGLPLTYQRYNNNDCIISNQILWKTWSTLITWSTTTGTIYFSYMMFDKQLSGSCFNISWTRSEDTMFINSTQYFTGDGNWWIISWEIFPQGITIIENAKYWKCLLTGDLKEIINYIPNTGSKQNDSCIIELRHGIYTVAAFTNINTGFVYSRTPEITWITKDIRNIIRTSILQTPTISSFTGSFEWETSQWSGISTNNIIVNSNNLIRKYSFDRIEITDSKKDFWYFWWEHGRKYLRNNWSTGWELVFNPKTKSRIINEPLQDYEYIFINSWLAYPGATKYGDIIYERTSNITGNINIETRIDNANTSSCPSSDWIIYQIKKSNTLLYNKDYQDTKTINNDIQTTWTSISYWDKLYFIINSKNNNQCDKIDFNVKIYQNETNDYSLSWQNIVNYWAISDNGKFYWWYSIWATTGQYLNIGTINKQTWLTFSTWIKTVATTDQTIIYKQWSYGLAIKDGELKVTNDEERRYSTNSQTLNTLTNSLRNHLVRTYDGTTMAIYLNGNQTRSGRIIGYYPTNNNQTVIGRSTNHGQFNWSLDELQVWNKTLNSNEIQNLYQTQLSKIDEEKREFSLIQTGLADGRYIFTGYINETRNFTGTTIIDNDPPVLSLLSTYTWDEWTGIVVSISGWDNGIWEISGYYYTWTVWSTSISTGRTTGTTIIIPQENEPRTGTIIIQAKDTLNHTTWATKYIEWINIPITTLPLIWTWYESNQISFVASGYDPGWTTSIWYQWYMWNSCLGAIIFSGKTFTTGRNEPATEIFSYTMIDKQWLSWTCSMTTGIRENIAPTAKDLFKNANWNTGITFTASGYDPGQTIFSAAWYRWNQCLWTPIATNIEFTTGSFQSGTRAFSYYLRDAQSTTWTNNWRDCQIATGYRPHINPIAHDFNISENAANISSTANRRLWSEARDSESNLPINATISSGSKGYCQLNNDWISFQPNTNQIWTWLCELRLTDNNNGITYVKAYALNIDTTPPQTSSSGTNESIKLIYNDTSTGTTYYKILTGVWSSSSCGNSWYNNYISWNTITIPYVSGFNDNKTLCYYSTDVHGNLEIPKAALFNQDTAELSASVSASTYMNNLFQATISINKACSWTLTGLYGEQPLVFTTAGTYSVTGSFTETSWPKTAYIFLQTNNPAEGTFSYNHMFNIDQILPSTPVIIENLQYNDYYSIKRSSSTDEWAGILWYNYQISNEASSIIKNWFTDVNYLNIFKSEVQNNSQISIKVQAQDKVNNISSRSTPTTITISSQQTTTIDTTPNQFTFTKVTNAKRDTEYTSNEIVIWWLSTNTSIQVTLSNWTLFINDTKVNSSGTVKNGDIVYIKLDSSDSYSETTKTTLLANNIASTYSITTESKDTSSTTSFLDELKKLLEQLKDDDTTTTTSTGIDTKWISAPYIAPNGKTYNLYKTLDGKYSAYNFIYKKTFNSLTELKQYIDKNNPR